MKAKRISALLLTLAMLATLAGTGLAADPQYLLTITAGSGGTALHSAAWNGDLPMVKLLVAAGANVAARDPEHDNTPAGWAEVAITVSNNPKCKDVVDYLSALPGV